MTSAWKGLASLSFGEAGAWVVVVRPWIFISLKSRLQGAVSMMHDENKKGVLGA